ncbi:MAG: hypothetical protein ACRDL2_09490 [Gaiellaceae bacterium]
MRTARLLTFLAAIVALAATAGTARSAASAPTGLHGFLLRADEPLKTTFSRTPSFAWNPVPGADHYEFQLSLSTTFRDNSIVFADASAVTPVEAPGLTLPWITGSPHALYARVRAVTADGTTPWSSNFGFDMAPATPPTPLSSYPGLLRWSPVEGASGYQVWLVDAHKIETSATNTLDEREFYTFHQNAKWTGAVRWRIRARRATGNAGAQNGIPAVSYGAWSPIYTSTNPAMSSAGPIKLVGTVSDVFSNGAGTSPAHRLMPGFLWTGGQTLDGTSVELYRTYVFTDKQCLNLVFTGAVTGAPAYAPRPGGPLALPSSLAGEASARSSYLVDGSEPPSFSYDNQLMGTTESAPAATPTTSIPGAASDSGSPATTGSPAPTTSSSSGSNPQNAPIDLWDTNWPQSGYYWTIVGVLAESPGALSTSVSAAGAAAATVILPVLNASGFNAGDQISIGTGPTTETDVVTAVGGDVLTLATALKFGHGLGEAVVRTGGSLVYQDLELPQDVCAAGRVMRFGKASEPSLVSSGDLFATGLSSDGRLTSAVHTSSFYGQPLVSWTPALGADEYQVQWSNTQAGLLASTGAVSMLTSSTSYVLPVGPGTWWYRVRGFDYSLPTGAQQMSWSGPVKLVVAKPRFKIVTGTTPKKKPKK